MSHSPSLSIRWCVWPSPLLTSLTFTLLRAAQRSCLCTIFSCLQDAREIEPTTRACCSTEARDLQRRCGDIVPRFVVIFHILSICYHVDLVLHFTAGIDSVSRPIICTSSTSSPLPPTDVLDRAGILPCHGHAPSCTKECTG